MLLLCVRNVQDLVADGKTPCERRLGEPFKEPDHSVRKQWFEYFPISAKDQSRLHQFGKRVLPGIFFGYALVAGRNLEGRHFWLQTLRSQENWDASEIHARRLNAKEILTSKMGEKFIFPIAGGTAELLGRDPEIRESNMRQCQPVGRLQRNPDGSQPTESKEDAEARNDFLVD